MHSNTAGTAKGSGQSERKGAGASIVVTGAGGGIGLAIVRRLLADGWSVLATDVGQRALQELHECRGQGNLHIVEMDVSDPAVIDQVAKDLDVRDQKVAGLVNVAGVLQDVVPLLDMDPAVHKAIWDVNYFGAENCLKKFAPLMVRNGGGAIVNITSVNEFRPLPLHAYAVTKVALGTLTTLAAGELGAKGIRVNSIAPGFTMTPVFKSKIESGKRDARVLESHTALQRLVGIDEIAAAVSFLLSDDASAITGVSLPVDAGWLTTSHWMNFRELAQGRNAS